MMKIKAEKSGQKYQGDSQCDAAFEIIDVGKLHSETMAETVKCKSGMFADKQIFNDETVDKLTKKYGLGPAEDDEKDDGNTNATSDKETDDTSHTDV